jgi:hypothetical protein
MHKIKYILFLAILTVFSNSEILAQCAMCKSVVGSNKDAGGNIANGLNTGILYLMAIPYLLLSVLAIYVFRRRIVQRFPALKNILKVE